MSTDAKYPDSIQKIVDEETRGLRAQVAILTELLREAKEELVENNRQLHEQQRIAIDRETDADSSRAAFEAQNINLRAELEKATKTQPINTHVRLFDLVRQARTELHQQDLITDEEYAWLSGGCSFAKDPKGGSPSPRRLEDYDALITALAEARKNGERLAQLAFSPTVGLYTIFQRGTTVVLKNFVESTKEAEAWCKDNGWTLMGPDLRLVVKALVEACREALDERANYSGMSDDSEPVLSRETRNKLRTAIDEARASSVGEKL